MYMCIYIYIVSARACQLPLDPQVSGTLHFMDLASKLAFTQ